MSSALNALRLAISGPSGINKGIELSIKNSPTGNYLKHNTNWEFNINSSDYRSKTFLNSIGSASISYTNTDFSEHYYDYYGNEKGLNTEDYRNSSYPSNPTVYTFENSWEPNDLALLDDIAVVGIKDFCPVSKQTWTFNSKISQYHYGRIDIPLTSFCQELMSTAYNYQSGSAPAGYNYFGVLISVNDSSYGTVDVTTYKCNGDVDQTLTFDIPAGASPTYEVVELAVVYSCPDVFSEPFVDIQGYAGNGGFNYYGATNPNPPEPTPAPTDPTSVIFDDGATPAQTPPNIIDTDNNRTPGQTSTIIDNPTLYDCFYNDDTIIESFGETTFVLDVKLGNILNKNTNWSEYIDLSDIFIEVNYDSSQQDSVVKTGKERIVYKFGGYIKDCSSLNGSNYTSVTNIKNKNYIDNEGEYYYYIQTPSTESRYNIGLEQPIVVLSSYVSFPLPSNINDYNFKGGPLPCRTEYGKPGYTTSFLPIHGLIVPVTSVKIHQVTVSPKAGKVEIYTRKSGKITGFNYGTLVVPEHNMQDGDIIKISGAFDVDYTLAVWMEDNGFIYDESEAYYLMLEDFKNNLNNVKYVKVVDENSVQIFEDKELTKIITVPINLSFQSDLVWTCIGNANDSDAQGWGFYSSLSSPSGRNGYTKQAYRKYESFNKPQSTNIVFDGYSQDSMKQLIDNAETYNPAHYAPFTYGNSWNNYYPLKRYPDDNITNLGITSFGGKQSSLLKLLINNGNNFGCSVDLKKYTDNEYILSIGEPGATDSFKILNQFEINSSDNPSSYGQYCPVNVRVVPKYLPYGRVHFYKITKNSYGGIRQIDYLNTINQEDHPWESYEQLNLLKGFDSYDYRYYATINYPIKSSEISNFILNASTYWKGAATISWTGTYLYNIGLGNYVDLENNKTKFAYLDRFGKSHGIDTAYDEKSAYFAISSDVRAATVPTVLYANMSFGKLPFYSNLPIFENKTIQNYFVPSIQEEKSEIRNFANKIVYKDSKAFFGWPNTYKSSTNLYYYKRSSGSHILIQTIDNDQSFIRINSSTNSTSTSTFGKFISYDGEYLITNGMCSETEDGIETSLPLDYLYIYKYNHLFDQFKFLQKLSATIDLSNQKYNSLANNLYIETTNYSYDRTKDNSATYISDMSGKYDVYGNALILRDPLEYVLYIYSATENKFVPRFHAFSRVDGLDYVKQIVKTDTSIIKMSRSQTPATLDSKTVFDNGQFSKSYQVIDFSNFAPEKSGYYSSGELLSSFSTTNFTEKNVGTAIDFLDPTYGLNLYIKTKSESSGVANLFTRGYITDTGSMPLFLKLQIEIAKSGVNLFAKQIDVKNSGLNLYMKPYEINNSGINLFTEAGKTSNMPLYVGYIIPTTGVDSSQDLILYNEYQGGVAGGPGTNPTDPNYQAEGTLKSGVYPLFIQSELYDDIASSFNLFIGEQPVQIDPDTGQPVVPVDATEYQTTSDLYISGPEYIYVPGTGASGVFNLYIGNKKVYSDLDMVVYNTVEATGLNLYTDCKYHAVSGITIFTSGYTIPSSTMNLYQRGYIPYG